MLTVYTSTCCRPDYVQLLAWALKKTLREPYRFVVVVHPGGMRRTWEGVDEILEGQASGYLAWREILTLASPPFVIIHDDCIPVAPWTSADFRGTNVIRRAGHTIQFHRSEARPPAPVIEAVRLLSPEQCPAGWPDGLRRAAAAANAESVMGGIFLHLDKGTIFHPKSYVNPHKPELVEAVAKHLGISSPAPLTAKELASHPGKSPEPGLGDMAASALSAVGITKERISKILGRPCNCPRRRDYLNRAGRRFGIGR